jgi:hypothetical protein
VFTARYALSPYIKQIRFVFKGLMDMSDNFPQTIQHPITDDSIFGKISLHLTKTQIKVYTSHQFESHKNNA